VTKTVLVTGGGKRVGRAIVEAAADSGWLPIVHYNSSGAEAEAIAKAHDGVAVQEDLSKEGAGTRLLTKAAQLVSSPITGLVNSASIFEHDTAQDTTEDALLKNFQIHTVAPVMLAQAFAAQAPDRSVVVNLLDQKLFNLNADHFAYTVSKQALHGATMTLAHALAPKVRVVGVAPGYNLPSPGQPEEVFNRLAPTVNVLERRLETEDVADTVLFALNNKAITGQVLLADNGEHLKAAARDIIFSE